MKNVKGKVIVITGASSGIGEATALSLAEKGAKMVLGARREERLKDIVSQIQKMDGQAICLKTDVSSYEQVKLLAEKAKRNFGRIDVWINNAGIMPRSFMEKLKVDEWNQMIDVNIKGVLYGVAAAIPVMKEQNKGHIINVSSVGAYSVKLGGAVYSGTKFAVRAITEGLRLELSSTIRTTLISPGAVDTELESSITDEEAMKDFLKRREQIKTLESKDIASAILFAIEQPDYVSVNDIIVRPADQLE